MRWFIYFLTHYVACNCYYNFYSCSCLGRETAKGLLGLRVNLPSARLSTTHGRDFTLSFYGWTKWTSSRKVVNTSFYRVWFDPIRNRTRVYRFSNRRSIHSTIDPLNSISPAVRLLVQSPLFQMLQINFSLACGHNTFVFFRWEIYCLTVVNVWTWTHQLLGYSFNHHCFKCCR